MSGVYEDMPFARGATFGTTDSTIGTHLEGREFLHQDKTYGTGRWVRVRVVRNAATIALAPKRALNLKSAAGVAGGQVNGYAGTQAQYTLIADEFLPSGGAAVGDLFYAVVDGPTLALTPRDAADVNVINVGDSLHAQSAAATTSVTAGHVMTAVFTGATAVLQGQIANVVGVALSAKTTANTDASVLINMGRF